MLKKTLGCMVIAGLMAPAFAGAQGLSYNYVQGGLAFYPGADLSGASGLDQDFIGLDADARLAITDDVFVLGGFQYLTDDVDYTTFHVGGGYRFALDPSTDIWGGLTIEYQEFDYGSGFASSSEDDTAIGFRGGVRHRLNRELELAGSLRFVTGDGDYVGLRGTATYYMRPDLGFFGSLDIFDGDPGLIGGARFTF